MVPWGGEPIRVFLVAEHAALRQSLEMLLAEDGMVICQWAEDAATALQDMPAGADVVIVGLSGRGQSGVDLLRAMASRAGYPPSLVLSVNDDAPSIRQAMEAGARGYVTNREAPEHLANAVRKVAAGRTWSPLLAERQD